jgi:CubicO group peptidase (beta-lactamase class C family)
MLFVGTHLKGGVTDNGDRLLSEEAVATMLRPQVEATGLFEGDFWGLGWWLSGREGRRIFGHYGWRSGQTCVLHAFPEQTAAVAVLTNADSGIRLYQEVLTAIEPQLGSS